MIMFTHLTRGRFSLQKLLEGHIVDSMVVLCRREAECARERLSSGSVWRSVVLCVKSVRHVRRSGKRSSSTRFLLRNRKHACYYENWLSAAAAALTRYSSSEASSQSESNSSR